MRRIKKPIKYIPTTEHPTLYSWLIDDGWMYCDDIYCEEGHNDGPCGWYDEYGDQLDDPLIYWATVTLGADLIWAMI